MAVLSDFTNPFGTITVSYNDVNLRLTTVDWVLTLPAEKGVRTRIWRMDIDPVNPVVDRTDFVNGSENVPGNLSVVEFVDPDAPEFGTQVKLPPELKIEHQVVGV